MIDPLSLTVYSLLAGYIIKRALKPAADRYNKASRLEAATAAVEAKGFTGLAAKSAILADTPAAIAQLADDMKGGGLGATLALGEATKYQVAQGHLVENAYRSAGCVCVMCGAVELE